MKGGRDAGVWESEELICHLGNPVVTKVKVQVSFPMISIRFSLYGLPVWCLLDSNKSNRLCRPQTAGVSSPPVYSSVPVSVLREAPLVRTQLLVSGADFKRSQTLVAHELHGDPVAMGRTFLSESTLST